MNASASQLEVVEVLVCQNPIFIIGSPRSGTSTLAQGLAQHSELWYAAEGQILFDLFGPDRLNQIYTRGMALNRWLKKENVTREEFFASVALGLNALFSSRSRGKRWVEKTPANTMMVDALIDMFPGASFLHLLRDGRSVVHSMVNFLNRIDADVQERWTALNTGMPPWATDFAAACRSWRRHVNKAMEAATLQPGRFLTVRNEELLQEPEKGFEEIFRFLQLPNELGPADFFRTHRINSSFHSEAVPATYESRPDPWKEWSQSQKRIFLDEAGATMLRYGLVTDEELRQMEEQVEGVSGLSDAHSS